MGLTLGKYRNVLRGQAPSFEALYKNHSFGDKGGEILLTKG